MVGMTTLQDRPGTALLVIDVQNGVVAAAVKRGEVIANIAALVGKARATGVPSSVVSRWCTSITATRSRTPT
jgi:nicotinamidase-related amidase